MRWKHAFGAEESWRRRLELIYIADILEKGVGIFCIYWKEVWQRLGKYLMDNTTYYHNFSRTVYIATHW